MDRIGKADGESKMVPSKYQEAIYEWVKNGEGNAVVEAVAGSGKTKVLLDSLSIAGSDARFLAFNKHIANELAQRAPEGSKISTIHSMGFATIRRKIKGVTVDDEKMRNIVADIVGDSYNDRVMRQATERLASIIRLTLTDPEDAEAVRDLIYCYDVDTNGDEDAIINVIPEVINTDKNDTKRIDFDDMIWLPYALKLNPQKHRWVFLDEAQDLSAAQRELVLRAVKKDGRVLACGDKSQAIYGWSGADTSSISKIIERINAKTLPLSICYRCPRSHVELAKRIVPQIEPAPWAKEGTIEEMCLENAVEGLEPGDMVICRVNAPLAGIAMALVRKGKKAVMRGRDIGKNLLQIINRVNKTQSNDLASVLGMLDDYLQREKDKLSKTGRDKKIASLGDRIETVEVLAEDLKTTEELERRIQEIFSNDKEGIVCSSIHRAKGLEANRVMFHLPGIIPLSFAKEPWEIQEEKNLKYVALTRAKEELWLVKK